MLLALFLGSIGAHRFYLGAWGLGLCFIGLSLLGMAMGIAFPLGAALALFDAVRFLAMKQPEFDARYNYRRIGAFGF